MFDAAVFGLILIGWLLDNMTCNPSFVAIGLNSVRKVWLGLEIYLCASFACWPDFVKRGHEQT